MTDYAFSIEGEPVGKGRPRFTTTRTGAVRTYTDKRTAAHELLVRRTFQSAYPGHVALTDPVSVLMLFYEGPRPVQKQQDLDNLVKLVLDALNGVAWLDDRQIRLLTAHVARNCEPRSVVEDGVRYEMGVYTNVQFKTWAERPKGVDGET